MRGLSCLSCLLALIVATPTAQAGSPGERWWGVIVGVGEYSHLDATLALEGPANDVPLVLDWLAHQQVPRRHLTVLADRVPHADGLPTRAAILAALAALSSRVQAGDLVLLYFAGHGSQQPQGERAWTKADGMDETFLPRDVGRWDGASGRVAGAIVGNEIGHVVAALRERGAFVWLVFDSCHSATAARAAAVPGMRARSVPPEALGVPSGVRVNVQPPLARLVQLSRRDLPGGYVAFYGAQLTETAPEMPLPAGAPDRRIHGLFTYAWLQSLGDSGAGSYRDLAHRILAFYTVTYPDTTPEFEGALDQAIATDGSLLAPGNWPAVRAGSEFHVAAGRLNSVTEGSLLALSPAFAASPMGLLRVRRATLTEAWADPVSEPRELKRWQTRGDHSDELGAGVARLLETNWDLKVRLAGPARCLGLPPSPLGCDPKAPVRDPAAVARARALLARVQGPAGLELTADLGAADLALVTRDHRLYLLSPHAIPASLERTASVDLDAASAQGDLSEALNRATRVVGLLKLAAAFPGKSDALHLEVWARARGGAPEHLDSRRRSVRQGEELTVRLQNTGSESVDTTIFTIDERFGIDTAFPLDRESNRLPHDSAPIEVRGWAGPPGRYVLLVISEAARPGQPHDFSYLAQPGVPGRRARQGGSDFEALLAGVGFAPPGTRGPITPGERRAAAIETIRYEVGEGR